MMSWWVAFIRINHACVCVCVCVWFFKDPEDANLIWAVHKLNWGMKWGAYKMSLFLQQQQKATCQLESTGLTYLHACCRQHFKERKKKVKSHRNDRKNTQKRRDVFIRCFHRQKYHTDLETGLIESISSQWTGGGVYTGNALHCRVASADNVVTTR